MSKNKNSTTSKKIASSKSASKKSPMDTKSIKIIIDVINDRYESNKEEEINEDLKKKVRETISDIKFINDLKKTEIIHIDKFIHLICILLPKSMNGGDDETLTKYEKAKYFTYDKKFLIFDIMAFASLIYSFILIYIAYRNFQEFYSNTDVILVYNQILGENFKKLRIDESSLTAFFKYTCSLIENVICSSGENIFKYIGEQIVNLNHTIIKDVSVSCFVNHENSYYDFILKGIQLWTNPTNINACSMEVASFNLKMDIEKKIHQLKLSTHNVNNIYIYTFDALRYAGSSIAYFKIRLGIVYCNAPRINKHSNKNNTLLIKNNSKGGTRKRKTKNTRRNYVM
jgi:hypothetical protein